MIHNIKFNLLIIVLVMAAIGYLVYDNYSVKKNVALIENTLAVTESDCASSTKKLNTDIANLNTDVETLNGILDSTKAELVAKTAALAETTAAKIDFETQYNLEKNKVNDLGSQVSEIQGKVVTLEKLKATDVELLKKYSKVYFLNENYVPKSFSTIDPEYAYNPDESYMVYSGIWPFLKNMLVVSKADGVGLKIISAYRSFNEQSSLKSSYKMTYGSGANKFSADQGYSEHQLGTTVDFTTDAVGSSFTGFDKTSDYQWLLDNAYNYGFVLSYPKDNAYYQFEPWHWRFVGRALAQKLHDEGKNFYNLDQREIDQYLVSFFD